MFMKGEINMEIYEKIQIEIEYMNNDDVITTSSVDVIENAYNLFYDLAEDGPEGELE